MAGNEEAEVHGQEISLKVRRKQAARAARASAEPGIERVAQGVAEEIGAQHGDDDGQPGKRDQPPRRAEVLAALAQHAAPAGRRRLHAQAEEAERRLHDDQLRELEARDHQGGGDHVGGDVAEQDAAAAGAERHRHRDELARLHRQHRDAHQLGVDHPAAQHQHDHEVGDARAQQRHERDGEEQVRQRELRLHRAHDDRVDAAAGPAADQAERDADGGGHAAPSPERQQRARCARRRSTRLSTSRPSGSVPSGLAHVPPAPGRRLEREGQVLVVVAARGDDIREGGHQERDHEDDEAGAREAGRRRDRRARARDRLGRRGRGAGGGGTPTTGAAAISTPACSPLSPGAIDLMPSAAAGRAPCRAGPAAGSR